MRSHSNQVPPSGCKRTKLHSHHWQESTHSSHLEYLQADIVGIACVVRKLNWTIEITTAVN